MFLRNFWSLVSFPFLFFFFPQAFFQQRLIYFLEHQWKSSLSALSWNHRRRQQGIFAFLEEEEHCCSGVWCAGRLSLGNNGETKHSPETGKLAGLGVNSTAKDLPMVVLQRTSNGKAMSLGNEEGRGGSRREESHGLMVSWVFPRVSEISDFMVKTNTLRLPDIYTA